MDFGPVHGQPSETSHAANLDQPAAEPHPAVAAVFDSQDLMGEVSKRTFLTGQAFPAPAPPDWPSVRHINRTCRAVADSADVVGTMLPPLSWREACPKKAALQLFRAGSNMRTGRCYKSALEGQTSGTYSIAISQDSSMLASGCLDGTVRLWDRHQPGTPFWTLTGHTSSVKSVAFASDSNVLVSGALDGMRLWDWRKPSSSAQILEYNTSQVSSVAISPNSSVLASGSYDGRLCLWDLHEPDSPRHTLESHTATVWSVAFSPYGNGLASCSSDLRLWDLRKPGSLVETVGGYTSFVMSAAFSPDNSVLAAGCYDSAVRLWDLRQLSSPVRTLEDKGMVLAVTLSWDSTMLASGSDSGTVLLQDLRDPSSPAQLLERQKKYVESVAFSPDGTWLAWAVGPAGYSSEAEGPVDYTVRLWDFSAEQYPAVQG